MDVELEPRQPDEIVRAVKQLLLRDEVQPDPWWRVGIEEALDPDA